MTTTSIGLLVAVAVALVTLSAVSHGRTTKEKALGDWLRGLGSDSLSNTFSGCGATLAVTTSLQILEYLPEGGIPAHIRCVWALGPSYLNKELYFDIQRFPPSTGLSVFYLPASTSTAFTVHKIPIEDQSEFKFRSYDRAYLLLSSESNEPGFNGTGFRLGFKGATMATANPGFSLHHATLPGGLRSHTGNYANHEHSSVIIQPPPEVNVSVRITTLDTEPNADYLMLYTLPPSTFNGTVLPPSSMSSGYFPFGPPNTITTCTEPRVLRFVADNAFTKTGFTLEWLESRK